MNARRILCTVLIFSLIAVGCIYLLLPAFAQDQRITKESARVGVTNANHGRDDNSSVPLAPPPSLPSYRVSANGIVRGDGLSEMPRLQELMIEYGKRKADVKMKESEIARQQSLLNHLVKQRDDLVDNAAIISKEMARLLDEYKKQLETGETRLKAPSSQPIIPVFDKSESQNVTLESVPPTSIQQKLDSLEKRLGNIEKRLPPR